MSKAETTTSHSEIRTWAEKREGRPSMVRSEGKGGLLRIDFGETDDNWDTFFRVFDDSKLAFLHQDKTEDGKLSRFNKFVER